MTGLERRKRYLGTLNALKTERAGFESHWQDLANHLMPRRVRFFTQDRNRGDKRNQHILDSEPLFAARTLQHGLHAGITSPARPWFRLTTPNPAVAELRDVKYWLNDVSERLRTIFLRSNLYNALPTVYGDLGVFGTACMSMLEDSEDMLRCYTYPLGSYVIGLDARSVATVFYYEYSRTVRQLVEEFGYVNGNPQDIDWSRFSERVKAAWQAGKLEESVDVVWAVEPNEEYDPSRLASKYAMRWRSCHFEAGAQTQFSDGSAAFLRESGFRRFPILAPRWETTGEDVYGTNCPGMTALPDVRSLQFQERKFAKGIDKGVDPPLVAPNSLRNQKVSLIAGDLTFDDERDGRAGLRPIHEVRMEGLQVLDQNMEKRRYRVDRAFYADLFLMLQRADMINGGAERPTAREVQERHEEKLLALGPVLERLNDELLDPLIDRGFDILAAAGAIPRPPDVLVGMELKVEYVSVMAQAQKLAGAAGLDSFVDRLLTIAKGGAPEILHKADWLRVADEYGDTYGVNPRLIVTTEDAAASIASAQQAQQQQQQAEQAKVQAQAAQLLGKTATRGGASTALDDTAAVAAAGAAA